MAQNDSKHLLPMTSILFADANSSSRPNTSHHLANPTLANLKDAQDTSITALPQPVTEAEVIESSDGFWKRLWAKIKIALGFGEQEVEYEEEREMCIGEPFGFVHIGTGGNRPLLGPGGVPRVGSGEEEWEDVE
ncbi:hypothetical protein J4E93_008003 [Alternaria ventricosa]|uniref:uncharacterized protein n=1 Tax=Alternaria ventricosa TaxID=1187951 RepID=UPI0020C53E93|nr:uncharacterized protein J4E93_008003 [Alternaria ventricosa]KAI4641125.1 hypothetical protein J4E93_008003 [Alternaria ventricosa]